MKIFQYFAFYIAAHVIIKHENMTNMTSIVFLCLHIIL